MVKEFVKGAIKNILQVINYYKNRGKNLEDVIDKIRELEERIDELAQIDEIMAI